MIEDENHKELVISDDKNPDVININYATSSNDIKTLVGDSVESMEKLDIDEKIETSTLMKIVYNGSFFLFGMSTLLLSSAFITNSQFFKDTVKSSPNLYRFFESSITSVSFISLIFSNLANLSYWYKFPERKKIYVTFSIIILGFVATSIVIYKPMADASFFAAIMVVLFLLNQCIPIVFSSFYNELSYFPPQCFKWYQGGQAFAGLFVPSVRILVTATNLDARTTSIIFFGIGIFIIISALTVYESLIRSKAYHIAKAIHLKNKNKDIVEVHFNLKKQMKSYIRIFKQTWKECLCVYLTLLVTILMHPVMGLKVKSVFVGTVWANVYYSSVAVFVTYNLGDLIGRYSGSIFKWPRIGSIWMVIVPILRLNFLFLYLLSNRSSKHDPFPCIFNHDAAPIIFELMFGIMNGHCLTNAFRTPLTLKDPKDIKICFILFVFLLDSGLASGAFLSYSTALF